MMEVKHSPSSQMDFRTATNGLPNDEEDEEMNPLLDKTSVSKSLPTSSCAAVAPIQNGNKQLPPLEDGMEIDLLDDDMNEELNESVVLIENKKENEETEPTKHDLDLFDLDLEHTEKVANGDATDSSAASLRDPGDDLDTLLSKINDLVEDCMEPSTGENSPKDVVDQLIDATVVDDVENKAIEPSESVDNTQVEENKEQVVEEEAPSVQTKNHDENCKEAVSESKGEKNVELEKNEQASNANKAVEDEEEVPNEEKTTVDLDEDISDENGCVDVTEADLELGDENLEPEEQTPEVAEEVAVEEISEEVVQSTEIVKETASKAVKDVEEVVEETVITDAVEENAPEEVEKENENVSDEIAAEESMDVDDSDIVCLDSPMPEENEEKENEKEDKTDKLQSETTEEENSANEQKDSERESREAQISTEKEDVPSNKVDNDGVVTKDIKDLEADDDVLFIEDEDECMTESKSDENTDKPSKESETSSKENVELSAEDSSLENKKEEEKKNDEETATTFSEKPSETNEEDDDDIVCLDDSLDDPKEQQIEEESKEETSPTDIEKTVDVDKSVEGTEKQAEVEKVAEQQSDESEQIKNLEAEECQEKKEPNAFENEQQQSSATELLQSTSQLTQEESKEKSDSENKSQEVSSEVPSHLLCDAEVITLDDDDEDMPAPATPNESKEKPTTEAGENKTSDLLSVDNSDNARDGSDEKDEKNDPKEGKEKPTTSLLASETNSNSSSNLLKESAATEREEDSQSEQPPAKRIRLSQDEASSSHEDANSKNPDDDDVMEIIDNNDDEEENKTLKRVHSSPELATSAALKKPKTDAIDAESVKNEEKNGNLLEEITPDPIKVEDIKKPIEAVKPLPLYPPPNFDTPKIDLNLDFLRRFKKSIHKMNKADLEELVLQKIVEAIVHKSEFSEMRELIEKQEKIITGHRTKITELNKQFRDLEMVHNRVLKDLETKNSQFIMPVKITRAVGLQVYFPNKKYDQPMASLPPMASTSTPAPGPAAAPSTQARNVSTGSSSSSSIPDRASIPTAPSNMNSPSTIPMGIATQQQQQQQQQQRRGCVQKLTPMRPDGPRSQMQQNRGVTAGVVSSSTSSPVMSKDTSPKILNRNLPSKARLPTLTNSGLNQSNIHQMTAQAEAERSKSQLIQQAVATKKTAGPLKTFPQSKRIPKSWQSEQATASLSHQPSPTTPTPSAPTSPMVPSVNSPLANSPLAAKTPNKSVIDLTDEDDASPASSSRTPITQVAAQKAASAMGGGRVGPYKVSVIPAAQLQQQPRPNAQKLNSPRPQNSPQFPAKPNGTATNSVRRTPPPPQAVVGTQRYRHPAPLPNQPIHSSNPLWKLPPARPTIRISNLESGIVISWTIEDTAKEKYAESTSYQIYAYQETSGPPMVESWRHVGDVKAMLLPMAVTLTQFQEGQRYYFAVRAVDAHNRCGPFSFAKTWS